LSRRHCRNIGGGTTSHGIVTILTGIAGALFGGLAVSTFAHVGAGPDFGGVFARVATVLGSASHY
jgi:hypothetical protein